MTITGLATTDIEIYKDGSATQRSSDAGFALLDTDGIDFDGITGIHGISIDTSDNTDAGFYAAGSDYWVVVSSITVDGATINFIAATFSIENRAGIVQLSDIESSLVIVKSDLVIATSDTTAIHSTVDVIATGITNLQIGVSDTESSLVIIKSDLVVITSDTTAIESELIVVHSETTVIASDTAVIEEDTSSDLPDLIGGIGAGSSSGFNYPVSADNTGGAIIDSVTFVGTQTGTYANTEANIATYHEITDASNAFDLVYRIAAGATHLFTSITINGYLNSSNDTCNIQLYDHVGTDWETVSTFVGKNGSTNDEITLAPLSKHTGALGTSEAGNIYVRFVCTAQTTPNLFLARVLGTAVAATSTMGYENGTVWVDETGGTSSGTTQGIDGIFANQSDDFDNGQTIADNLGTSFIHIHPGNSITLTAALQGYNVTNVQATLNGGSQNTDSTRVTGGFIEGTWARAGTGITTFVGCSMTSVTADRCAMLQGCGIVGTFTLSEAGLYPIVDAQAGGATGIATIDFASLGGATVNMEGWKGNLTIANIATGDTLNLHAAAGGDIVLGGANGTVNISGVVGSVTDNRTGSPTLSDLSSAARFTTVDAANSDIESSLVIVKSDLVVVSSDTAAIEAAGGSLSTAQDSKLTQVHSDLIIVGSDVVIVVSDTTAIEAAGGSLSTAQDSKLTQVHSDLIIVGSDVVVLDAAVSDVESSLVIVKSDLVIATSDTAAIHSQTTRIESDLDVANFTTAVQTASDVVSYMDANSTVLSDVESSLVIIKSDLVVITSDTTAIESELIAVHSETTVIASDTAAVESGVSDVESSLVIVKSDLVVVSSDTAAAESAISDVESSLVVIKSDTTAIHSDTTQLQLGIIYGSAATGTLSTTQATTDLSGYTADQLIGRVFIPTSGAADGEATDITDFVVASGLITFTAMTVAMANGDTFKIV